MPPRKRRRTTSAPRRGGSTTASSSPPTTPVLPARLLADIAARTDAATIFRCAATSKLFRREILHPSFIRRVCRNGVLVPSATTPLLGLLDRSFSLVHPTTPPAAASFAENHLAPFVSRSAGGLLEEYEAVTSRGGLVLLERHEINRRRRSQRRSDMCVYDTMTSHRAFFPFPPDINRNPFRACVYRYVLLTAADGITAGACSFMVLAADMTSLQDCNSTIGVQTVSSSSGCQWSPISYAHYRGPPWSVPLDGHDAAVVLGGVVHWVMIECEHILTYDVATGKAGLIGLPHEFGDRMAWTLVQLMFYSQ